MPMYYSIYLKEIQLQFS